RSSAELEAISVRALAKEPGGRWPSAEEMSRALATVPELGAGTVATGASSSVASVDGAGKPPSMTMRVRTLLGRLPRDRRSLAIAGGALGALLLLLVLVVILVGRKPPPPLPRPATAPPVVMAAPESESGRRHLAQALAYQRRLWCSDALEELD